jgi:type VI secretion system protein ImpA
MPLRDDLLTPIPGENPSGSDLRYNNKVPIYDQVKEARRQDDDLAQGDWQHERKVADYAKVINLTQDALASKSKDLQLAAWFTDASLRTQGFAGLADGLKLCHGLVYNFWDTLNPPLEDGDEEPRMAHLEWIGSALEVPLKSVGLNRDGHNWLKYKESRTLGYEDQVKADKDKKLRAQRIAEGKLAPEAFDKSFVETPKAFYLQSEKELDQCLKTLGELDELCGEKFTSSRPTFRKLHTALNEVRHVVHALLEKKRETEPDPVEEVPAAASAEGAAVDGAPAALGTAAPSTISFSVLTSSEPADRREAIASVAKVAAFLRKREPLSPAPYLMMRGLRWGELRSTPNLADSTLLEAPPTELRQHLKRLALGKKWNELLEAAENTMSLPCSRGWLDLQRLVVGACSALGSDYDAIATAITSELRALLNDVPQLLDVSLLDDTPAANTETRAWLQQLNETPAIAVPSGTESASAEAASSNGHRPSSWLEKAADPYIQAKEAQKGGLHERAFEIMRREIARQTSGRGRFERTIQLVELCVGAGKEAIAQPLLEDIAAAIEIHKLDDWEDKKMVAGVLMTLMTTSKKIQGSASEKQKLFERICRLDPVRALNAG